MTEVNEKIEFHLKSLRFPREIIQLVIEFQLLEGFFVRNGKDILTREAKLNSMISSLFKPEILRLARRDSEDLIDKCTEAGNADKDEIVIAAKADPKMKAFISCLVILSIISNHFTMLSPYRRNYLKTISVAC